MISIYSTLRSVNFSEYCVIPDRTSRANGGPFDSSAKSLCMDSTLASEGRLQQAVEHFGAIRVCENSLFSPIVSDL